MCDILYELTWLSGNGLKEKLQEKVTATVNVRVRDDEMLIVEFFRDGVLEFKYRQKKYVDFLHLGGNNDDLIGTILTEYKKEILKKYFL